MASSPNPAQRPAHQPTRIQVRSLHKRFALKDRQVIALGDPSFEVADHEFVSLIGPRGCGKSTVLNIAVGLMSATSGAVYIAGEAVTRPLDKVGYIFQKDTTFPWKTVEENIGIGLEYRGMAAGAVLRRASACGGDSALRRGSFCGRPFPDRDRTP